LIDWLRGLDARDDHGQYARRALVGKVTETAGLFPERHEKKRACAAPALIAAPQRRSRVASYPRVPPVAANHGLAER